MTKYIKKSYISNALIYLRDYLTMSDSDKGRDLAGIYPDVFNDFIEERGLEEEYSDDVLDSVPEELLEEFFLYTVEIRGVATDPRAPPYLSMGFIDIVQNQWMIHFTDDADSVASDGFTSGTPGYEGLALSTRLTKEEKPGGFNFAYLLSDYSRYGKDGFDDSWKYGNECVVFRASGIYVDHYGDQEPQVIFLGETAKDIVPIKNLGYGYSDGEGWCAGYEHDTADRLPYCSEDLSAVVTWVVNNFNQYKKLLTASEDNVENPEDILETIGDNLTEKGYTSEGPYFGNFGPYLGIKSNNTKIGTLRFVEYDPDNEIKFSFAATYPISLSSGFVEKITIPCSTDYYIDNTLNKVVDAVENIIHKVEYSMSSAPLEKLEQILIELPELIPENATSAWLSDLVPDDLREAVIYGAYKLAHRNSLSSTTRDYLKENLPIEYSISVDERDYDRQVYDIYIEKRELDPHPPALWMHVVNTYIDDPIEFVNNFLQLDGEVCVSDPEDDFFTTRNEFFGILLHGPAVNVEDLDVYSEIDLLGRRYTTGRTGSERTEAWIVPNQCELYGVVTTIEDFIPILEENGWYVDIDPYTLHTGLEYVEEDVPEEYEYWEDKAEAYGLKQGRRKAQKDTATSYFLNQVSKGVVNKDLKQEINLRGRLDAVTVENLYELTYKYQILEEELLRGDLGMPSQLNDRAYLEYEKIKNRLNTLLDIAIRELLAGFDEYLDLHFYDHLTAWDTTESVWEGVPENLKYDLNEVIVDIVGENATEKEIKDHNEEIVSELKNRLSLEDFAGVLTDDFVQGYYDIKDGFETANTIHEKILLFQQGLMLAHVTGRFAEWVIDLDELPKNYYSAEDFLDSLSSREVDDWNNDLAKILGYYPGERAVENIWFDPEASYLYKTGTDYSYIERVKDHPLMYKESQERKAQQEYLPPQQGYPEMEVNRYDTIPEPIGYVYHVSPYAEEILEQGFIIDPTKTTLGAFGQLGSISTTNFENAQEYKRGIQIVVGVANGELNTQDLIYELGYNNSKPAVDYIMKEEFKECMAKFDVYKVLEDFKDKGKDVTIEEVVALRKENIMNMLPDLLEDEQKSIQDYFNSSDFENLAWRYFSNDLGCYGNELTEEEARVRRWRFLKAASLTGNLPLVVGYDIPEHLKTRTMDDVGIVEVAVAPTEFYDKGGNPRSIEEQLESIERTRKFMEEYDDPEYTPEYIENYVQEALENIEDPKGKFTYTPSEQEWKFYDPTDLWPIRLVGQQTEFNFGDEDFDNTFEYLDKEEMDTEIEDLTKEHLFHGTIKDFKDDIIEYGLIPQTGKLTEGAYGDVEELLEEFTFAADLDGLLGCLSAIDFQIKEKLGKQDVTEEDIKEHGILFVLEFGKTEERMTYRPPEDIYEEYPTQVEPGDYYSDEPVEIDYWIEGQELVNFFRKYGVLR